MSGREGKRDEERPGIPSLAGPAWLYSESLRPVFPAAVGRDGNKASQSTTWGMRVGISKSRGTMSMQEAESVGMSVHMNRM